MNAKQKLISARDGDILCRITLRSVRGTRLVFVNNVSDTLVYLTNISDDIRYNGFQVVKISRIASIDAPHEFADFIKEALRIRYLRKPKAPALDIEEMRLVLKSLPKKLLATIFCDTIDPYSCKIGTIKSLDGRYLVLNQVTPHARWNKQNTGLLISSITRIEFSDSYSDALALVLRIGETRKRK